MQNKDIQEIRINMLDILLFACKDESNKTYQVARDYLKILISGLNENKDFYNQEYKG